MTIERPMFPPRAESLDSFSHQPGIGQPDGQNRTSDSPTPPEGFHHVPGADGRVWFKATDESSKPSGGNVLSFPTQARLRRRAQRQRGTGANIRTLCFRSYELIVESDEAQLLCDVRLDTRKAEVKLRKVQERLQSERDRSAATIELLSAAEAKLSAAIIAALLSGREG